jgi:glycosyltransferase involved in cell wall biosynthesis
VKTLWTPFDQTNEPQNPLLIVWAARWEYDKGPDRLLAIVERLESQNINFRLCIMGQKFRQVPAAFSLLATQYAHRIDQFGYAQSTAEYFSWLQQADIFLSTAIHEFQGLSLLEALRAKCCPVLPDRLVYPELVESQFLYKSHETISVEANYAVEKIQEIAHRIKLQQVQAPQMSINWLTLRPRYQQLIEETASRN